MMNSRRFMTSITIMHPSIYTCTSRYPIVELILSSLSATDCSSFIHATKIDLPHKIVNKYVNIMRDIPEHLDWILEQRSIGNRVDLVGVDLERWGRRIMHPWEYDRKNEKPLCIWLMVTPSRGSRTMHANGHFLSWQGKMTDITQLGLVDSMPFGPRGGSTSHYMENGEWEEIENILSTTFVCRFDHMSGLPSGIKSSNWFISTIPNENNIKIVYFAGHHMIDRGLRAYLEPCIESRKEANMCRKMLTGEKFDMVTEEAREEEWNVPLVRSTHEVEFRSSTLRYDVARGGVEEMINGTYGYPPMHTRNDFAWIVTTIPRDSMNSLRRPSSIYSLAMTS